LKNRTVKLKGKQSVPDPLRVLLSEAVVVYSDGEIETTTKDAAKLIEIIGLNDPAYRDRRRLQIRVLLLADAYDSILYRFLLGFPDDLPNLARLNPAANHWPKGTTKSYYEQQNLGILPDTI